MAEKRKRAFTNPDPAISDADVQDRGQTPAGQVPAQQATNATLFNNPPDAAFALDPQGYVTTCNHASAQMLGYAREEVVGRHYRTFIHEGHRETTDSQFARVLQGHDVVLEITMIHKDGRPRPTRVTAIPLLVDGQIMGVCGIVRDLTREMARAEFVQAQNRIYEMMVSEQPLDKVLHQIAVSVETVLEDYICCILLVDDQENRLRFTAGHRLPRPYVEIIDGLAIGPNEGSCGTAAYTRRRMIVEDIASHPAWEAYREAALAHGLRACWSTPVLGKDKQVLGTLALYARKASAPTDRHLALMDLFARAAGTAISKSAHKEQIERLIHQDALTGVANASVLEAEFAAVRRRVDDAGTPIAFVDFDFDDFHAVNLQLGHTRAEAYLANVIAKVEQALAGLGRVVRLGGDEFAALMPLMSGEDDLYRAAETIQQILAQPVPIDGLHISVTASIGAAIYPQHGATLSELRLHAETATAVAKRGGKNQLRVFQAEMDTEEQRRMQMVRELRDAVESDQFFLVFQPRIDTVERQIKSCEALIRWRHPERGTVAPDQFIPTCEETGLIIEVGHWALREVCRLLKSRLDAGESALRVAINFSPRQFQVPDLVEQVREVLEAYQIPPRLIEIEITENTLMIDRPDIHQKLHQFREMGITISVDDFGVGYSSIGFLKRFPLDCVKIDQSFIRDVTSNRENAVLTNAIVQLAHGLGMSVVAEGVETAEQEAFLREVGCAEVQGFLYSKPLPPDEFVQFCEAFYAAGQTTR